MENQGNQKKEPENGSEIEDQKRTKRKRKHPEQEIRKNNEKAVKKIDERSDNRKEIKRPRKHE